MVADLLDVISYVAATLVCANQPAGCAFPDLPVRSCCDLIVPEWAPPRLHVHVTKVAT